MNMNMNTNNGTMRQSATAARCAGPGSTCGGAPIEAGRVSKSFSAEDRMVEAAESLVLEARNEASSDTCNCKRRSTPEVSFCETITLNERFDTSGLNTATTRIAYDTDFLGFTVEEETVAALLPCGGCCEVTVQKITLAGAIPYIISVGSVSAGCGSPVDICFQGTAMVDLVIGYVCGDEAPELGEVSCSNVRPFLCVSSDPCGCSEKTNVTVCGKFVFHNIPVVM